MRILQVNKFHYPRGGADKYYLELGQALEDSAYDVAYFSMHHPKNIESKWSPYFVSRLSFNEGGFIDKLKIPFRIIYSFEAKRKFKKLVLDFEPDIIHIHNIYHQLSPSILHVARKYKIPVLMHLHDYKLICPNYQLFAHGRIYEDFKPDNYFNCFKTRCFKNSRAKSFLASLEMTIHHKLWHIYKKNIARYIAPSQFMINKVVEYGYNKDKFELIYNPFSAKLEASNELLAEARLDNYLLYFGRLSAEKGIDSLILAVAKSKHKLKIAGEGEDRDKLESLAKENKADVEFLGFKSGAELRDLIMEAKATVLPSIWYENMPLSMLEALNLACPVIAANIGGMPEMVVDGKNGFLFEPGNVESLVEAIERLGKADMGSMRQAARASAHHLSMDSNLKLVLEVYKKVLDKSKL